MGEDESEDEEDESPLPDNRAQTKAKAKTKEKNSDDEELVVLPPVAYTININKRFSMNCFGGVLTTIGAAMFIRGNDVWVYILGVLFLLAGIPILFKANSARCTELIQHASEAHAAASNPTGAPAAAAPAAKVAGKAATKAASKAVAKAAGGNR